MLTDFPKGYVEIRNARNGSMPFYRGWFARIVISRIYVFVHYCKGFVVLLHPMFLMIK
jgi:hypothetical protein